VLAVVPWLLMAWARPSPSWRGAALLAATAVLIEWVRTVAPLGGFPWGLVAYSQVDGPVVQWARLGGDAAVTGWVFLLGHAVWRSSRWRGGLLRTVLACATVGLLGAAPVSATLAVAAIQGNVPRLGLDDVTQAQAVFDNHVAQTETLVAQQNRPDLIVWPENAVDTDPLGDASARQHITTLAGQLNRPILVGGLVSDGDVLTNSGLLWMPDGTIAGRYDKNHLVPFGEYIPWRTLLASRISRLDQIPRDMTPGRGAGILSLTTSRGISVKLGDVICFEVAYDDHVRHAVRQGAQLLTVQSNNATYAYTDQPAQQLMITRFRAIEHHRAAIVATTTGDSALIAQDGRVVATATRLVAATVTGQADIVSRLEPVDRWWPWPRLVALALVVAEVYRRRSWRAVRGLRPRASPGGARSRGV
jgi:apolipoprotein N-acyltransferase